MAISNLPPIYDTEVEKYDFPADFIGFHFGPYYSLNCGIYRVSDGSRFNSNLTPGFTDKTATIPGLDGSVYFSSQYSPREFSVKYAFDEIDEEKFVFLKKWFNCKEMHDLVFDEEPYKIYTAKVTK